MLQFKYINSRTCSWVGMQELSRNARRYRQSIALGALVGFGFAVIFAAGFAFRGFLDTQPANAADASSATNGYILLDEVQTLLDEHYLRSQPDTQTREYAAIRGMLGALNDRYTFFIDPPVAQSESDVLAGTYGGIGVQIKRTEAGEIALYPFVDSPAATAGIQNGDVLIAINDTPITISHQQDAIDQMLRGEVKEGSGVSITFRKQGETNDITVFVPFATINVPSVIWRKAEDSGQIGYIQILLFTSRTPEELKIALQELLQEGVKGLILDLRNNSGGLLQESVIVASQFINDGVIVYEKTNHEEQPLFAQGGGLATEIPLVVLVNQGTASAAELVAGAIRDRERGILIGQTTFGKGTVQQIYRLSDDSSLHITAAEWLTPSRQVIDGKGLEPTIAMIPDADGRDVEIGEAIRYLMDNFQEST
jgi:carboxyl-terminal processing protease